MLTLKIAPDFKESVVTWTYFFPRRDLYWCFQVWLGHSPTHGHSSDEKLSSREHIVLLGISRGWVIGIGAMGGGQDVSRSHAILPREENSSTETNAWSSYQSH